MRYHISDYFRNPEIRHQLAAFFLLGIVVVAGSFWLWRDGVFPVLLIWFFMGILHFAESFFRYRKIAELAAVIDDILHGKDMALLREVSEGELSILESEVNKMLIRLREQNLRLSHDKQYLADSLADLSHQLKTPLTSMNLLVTMGERESASEEKRLEYDSKIRALLQKMQWLIDVLLKISKLDADAVVFEQKEYPLRELVQKADAPLEIAMELKGITLETEITEEASFSGDMKWTSEAVENIVKNCMEHTPAGGKIMVTGRENAVFSELVITDNGEGIPEEDLPHLFERFYKGKNSSEESVGIGLALAHMIVTKQRGTLKAENRREGGARFTIRFYKCTL